MEHTDTMPWDREFDEIDEEYKHIFKEPIRWGYKILKAIKMTDFSDGSSEEEVVENISMEEMFYGKKLGGNP